MAEAPVAAPSTRPFVVESRGALALHFKTGQIESRMRLDDPYALDLEYTRTMMAFLLFVPDPLHLVMVGLGGGSLAKFCHRHLPLARMQVVEINPQVIALREAFQVPADGPRFQVVAGDGARFVRQAELRADVILVDGFDAEGVPEALASQRFYDDCHAGLLPGGMLVVNLHQADARHDALVDRLRRSFDDAVLVVGDDDGGNSVVFASKGGSLSSYRPGLARHPAGLDGTAAQQLLAAFARVAAALRDPQR
jgi:spermidine synthase